MKGYGAAYSLDETHARLNLLVCPRHRRLGIGTLLLEAVEAEIRLEGKAYLQARLLEGMDEGLLFALSRGFMEIHRMRGMSLRAGDFNFDKWKGLGERLSRQGFRVTTFKDEDEAGNTPVERLAELSRHAREGWPLPDPTWKYETSEERLRSPFTNPAAPERFSIMKFGDEYVGFTSADRSNMSGTGVDPRYRGRGIATYLKAYDIKRCVEAGHEYFESSSANPAMLRVNEKLGYRFNGLTEIRLLKYL